MPDGIGQMATSRLVVGVVTGAHGVRGNLRVKSFTADPADLTAYGPLTDASGQTRYDLKITGVVKGQLIGVLSDCRDRNKAESLRGLEFYLERNLLPETDDDEFYHADLIGLDAVDGNGAALGSIRAVFDFGSGDMLEVVQGDGKVTLYSFTTEIVPSIDFEGGTVTILPPEEIDATKPSDEAKVEASDD